jgi:hypothetical protein
LSRFDPIQGAAFQAVNGIGFNGGSEDLVDRSLLLLRAGGVAANGRTTSRIVISDIG